MNPLLTLTTIKGNTIQELQKTLESLVSENPSFGKKIRLFLDDKYATSVFEIRASADNIYFARVALISIILADIATVPDQHSREIYSRPIRELCKQYKIEMIDIEIFSKYVTTFENILGGNV